MLLECSRCRVEYDDGVTRHGEVQWLDDEWFCGRCRRTIELERERDRLKLENEALRAELAARAKSTLDPQKG